MTSRNKNFITAPTILIITSEHFVIVCSVVFHSMKFKLTLSSGDIHMWILCGLVSSFRFYHAGFSFYVTKAWFPYLRRMIITDDLHITTLLEVSVLPFYSRALKRRQQVSDHFIFIQQTTRLLGVNGQYVSLKLHCVCSAFKADESENVLTTGKLSISTVVNLDFVVLSTIMVNNRR